MNASAPEFLERLQIARGRGNSVRYLIEPQPLGQRYRIHDVLRDGGGQMFVSIDPGQRFVRPVDPR